MSRSVKGVLGLKKLIIVESPTKARTISAFLGKEYLVLSSQGHVRDLPKKDLGVDIENDFTPKFETKRTKQVKLLRDAAKGAQAIYLATDHDREGEAIAYDLYTILKRVVPDESAFSRPVFNEITKRVILEALKSPSQIDLNKVEAQRTRRILDRLVGYQVSPLLSRIIAGSKYEGLSAGRVQSVALRFLCDREAEIASFVPKEYWEISVELSDSGTFVASLTKKDGKKFVVRSAGEAEAVEAELRAARIAVKAVEEKERLRQPPPPFITSSMQQAASSTLGFSPKRTMRVAQELYEGVALPDGTTGLITYMRTDSVRMSDEAIGQARKLIERNFGKEYLAEKPRRYRNKKRSQDAHEAIRPTDPARTPETVAPYLSPDQRKLYTLIYNRFLATQMAPAVYRQRKVIVQAGDYTLEAAGSTLVFPGFLKLFPEPKKKDEQEIPSGLRQGEALKLVGIKKVQKFTEPPRRYSEAGLVNLLEKEGVGRPSTYASIISVIQERGYAVKERGS
ncbi:MAG TPA: type I DNA topoisomerase, partial [Candidatus Acetothermia bacterium]|nr:type I DNA topoisomerase [Candidatus Acetothermia bacterium]